MIAHNNPRVFKSIFFSLVLCVAVFAASVNASASDWVHIQYNDPTAGTGLMPRFEWSCGCAPTAFAMVLGYWDNYGPTGGGNWGKFTAYGRLIDYYIDEDTLESYYGSDGTYFYWRSSGYYPTRPMLIVDLAWEMDTTGGGSTDTGDQAPGVNSVVESKGYGNGWANKDEFFYGVALKAKLMIIDQ